MMPRFRDIPIKRKLMLVIMMTSTAALLVATVTVATFGWKTVRCRALVNDLEAVADIVGANSTAAISFNDPEAAAETLASVKTRPEIVGARIYDREGKVLAKFDRDASVDSVKKDGGYTIAAAETGRYLQIVRPIRLDGEIIGRVQLRVDLQLRKARLKTLATIVGALIVISWLVALTLSTYLQRLISAPILALASVAREVQERKDYSLRAQRHSKDEIGALVDGFNQMLVQVQSRDRELLASEERFRQLAENISEVFWMTDVAKNEMIYVSPGYGTIWGRTRESLYAEPRSWTEAIHPDDRERVRQSVLTKQVTGEYDEEYRIVRPTGSVRWIRDRAYPVRDDSGQVYRIVGIAEDITERKRLEEEILDIGDRERRRIGQDIHDGLCQHLAGTAFAAKALEQTLATSDSSRVADVREIARLINEAITEARHIARGLSPVELEPQGLMTALEQLVAYATSAFGVDCTFSCRQAVPLRDNAAAAHLYRIAQEAVNNAIKHARPKHIWVALTSANGRVNLTVEDDGAGIAEVPESKGMGLQIMAYRARMMGGLLDIQRQEGGGTIVTCSVEDAPLRGNGDHQP
jgi:PAS domain S-box-containing protein